MISTRIITAVIILVIAVCLIPATVPAAAAPDIAIVTQTDPPAETPAPPAPAPQGKFGIGFTIGEFTSFLTLPVPSYGLYGIYAVSPSINVGMQVGFVSGSSTGNDEDKQFEKVTTFNITPFAQFYFGGRKDFNPFIKAAFSFINYDMTDVSTATVPGKTTSKSASSLWAAVGVQYNVSESFGILGAVRFIDIGVSGDTKMSSFGIMSPSISAQLTF